MKTNVIYYKYLALIRLIMIAKRLIATGVGLCLSAALSYGGQAEVSVLPNYRITAKKPDMTRINHILYGGLERVTDAMQKVVNDFGGVVIFFDGKFTDNGNISSLRGKAIPGMQMLYDDASGIYMTEMKEAFVKQYPDNIYPPVYIGLHEYGHLVDHAFGSLSESEDFKLAVEKTLDSLRKDPSERIRRTANDGIIFEMLAHGEYDQVWADSFARFYISDQSRATLREDFRDVHDYFVRFEEAPMKMQ